jgi:hypothetical protein
MIRSTALARELVLLAALAAVSCRPPAVSLEDVTRKFQSKDYERFFESWTRHGEVYNLDTLENSLKVSATYLSWEMRQAYVARYVYDYGLDPKGRAAMLEEEREKFESANEFVVAATATKQKWAYFHRDTSPWRITLITSQGVEVFPDKLERIRKPPPMLRAYFPYVTIYREMYRFHFPVTEEGSGIKVIKPGLKSFSLVFAGALGRVELKWNVRSESGG